jgi:hypothetical protein
MKKSRYKVRLLLLVILIIAIAYQFYTFKSATTRQEKFTKLAVEGSNLSKSTKKRVLKANANYYANSEFAKFFEDVPCKESYLIYNYFAQLQNSVTAGDEAMTRFAVTLAQSGLIDKALELADMQFEPEAYKQIILELIKAKDIDRAIEVTTLAINNLENNMLDLVDKISLEIGFTIDSKRKDSLSSLLADSGEFKEVRESIISYLADNGEFDRAMNFADSFYDLLHPHAKKSSPSETSEDKKSGSEESFNRGAYIKICFELAKQGKSEEAFRFANAVNNSDTKLETLLELARGLIETGQSEKGKEVLHSALEIIDSGVFDHYWDNGKAFKVDQLCTIAEELAKAGDKEASKIMFEKAIQMSLNSLSFDYMSNPLYEGLENAGFEDWALELATKYYKTDYLLEIAGEYFKNNQMDLYDQMIQKVFEMDKEIDIADAKAQEEAEYKGCKIEPKQRDYFEEMSNLYEKSGNHEKALEMACSIKDKEKIYWVFYDIVRSFAKDGRFEQAINCANEINRESLQFDLLKIIVYQMKEQNNYELFDMVFDKMLEIASSNEDPNERIDKFYDIAGILLGMPCEEQQKYIQKFVNAYDKGDMK